jgi:hypothetical protein
MKLPSLFLRLKGFRYPIESIVCAVWIYHRFLLGTADVEDLLAERGVVVSRETVRLWSNRVGLHFAGCIRHDRPKPNDKWHLDEAVIVINGVNHWLWRGVDANGDVLDLLVQQRRKTLVREGRIGWFVNPSDGTAGFLSRLPASRSCRSNVAPPSVTTFRGRRTGSRTGGRMRPAFAIAAA